MKVLYKLNLLIIIAFFALTIVGYTSFSALYQSNTTVADIYANQLAPTEYLGDLRATFLRINSAILQSMLNVDSKKQADLDQSLIKDTQRIAALLEKLENINQDPQAKALFVTLKETRKEYIEIKDQVHSLTLQNDPSKNAQAYQLYLSSLEPLTHSYIRDTQALTDYYIAQSAKSHHENDIAFDQVTYQTIAIIITACLLLAVSGLAITRSITAPLQSMVTICHDLASGDFRGTKAILHRRDELGQLSEALTDMRTSLRSLLLQVNQSVEQVAASSEELTASADQVAKNANSVATAVDSVANGIQTQLSSTSITATATEQMSVTVRQISANTQAAASSSAHTACQAEQGKVAIDKSVVQMTALEQSVTESADVIIKLGERSKEISQIIVTISGIAGQTNLLALNAAIEAARAGDQGRGFAVVAEEVRKLAEQSQDATKKIAALLGGIQEDTEKAVLAMQTGTVEVKQGVQTVKASGQAFQAIVQATGQESKLINEIAHSVEEMAASISQVAHSAKQVEQLSKEAAFQTQSIAAATEEQLASMQEIAASGNALAKLGEALQDETRKFQI